MNNDARNISEIREALGFGRIALIQCVSIFLSISIPSCPVFAETGSKEEAKGFFADWIVGYLKGVEIGLLSGRARVSSAVRVGQGDERTIASGESTFTGVQVSLSDNDEGFSLSLVPTYIYHSIVIKDFGGDVPTTDTPGTENVPYVESDYDTGEVVDSRDPNAYRIRVSSLGLSLRPSYSRSFLCHRASYCPVVSAFTGATILERVSRKVSLGSSSEGSTSYEWLKSFTAGMAAGVLLPKLHSSVKLGLNYHYYPAMRLPRSLEFRDKVEFNEEKNAFERRRVSVEQVELGLQTYALTYAYYF
jgi:hypothetical protein